jgi:hypothetical protein
MMTDKSNRLPVLAAEIMRAHAEARRAAHMSLVYAIEAGEALLEAKEQMNYGEWLPWLQDTEISESTAQVYMRLAKHNDEVLANPQRVADLSIRAALDALRARETRDAGAKRIAGLWASWQENLHQLVACLGEVRQSLQDQGGDEAFKSWLVTDLGCGEASADKVLSLLDAGSDDAWSEAILVALERAAQAEAEATE